ncbi:MULTISPECIES: hypothetical protein [Actinomadura]|jgi:hypothetical protein|uniref:Uncharacterized protein n=1 Tax=Actinomadura montaniterrae TaxID=1803903 RepID=A0A6L3VWU2_9ACTN|nr:hypothetical protein [Actinomadura montaniterrae]KAB2382247.1 hypothetical protein F9B16_14720 [Actinomadura montaniterrae]HEU5027919.1 hypothetical protein [Spirillospora sp.]
MPSSILRPRIDHGRKHVKSTSLRALAVAARLERHHAPEGPPGRSSGRDEQPQPERRAPDPA